MGCRARCLFVGCMFSPACACTHEAADAAALPHAHSSLQLITCSCQCTHIYSGLPKRDNEGALGANWGSIVSGPMDYAIVVSQGRDRMLLGQSRMEPHAGLSPSCAPHDVMQRCLD